MHGLMQYHSPWGKGVGTQGILGKQDPESKKLSK